ncbi:MAG: hypothetical protein HY744_25315 [Deltaproteobacteria bacterium]|nr:hypothetical protein [Deltaproteobacteria bacterium]
MGESARRLGLCAAFLAAACSAGHPASGAEPSLGATAAASPGPSPGPAAVAPAVAAAASVTAAPFSASSATAPAPAADPAAPFSGPLATFYAALRELERGGRKQHVRIAWLGDSHAQADFWTGAVRTGLQRRFGNAGPGFVHVGYKNYRHDGMIVRIHGSWRMRPKPGPATTLPWGDGTFGLGGVLVAGYADEPSALLELTDKELAGKRLRWDLCYRLNEPSGQYRLQLGEGAARTVGAKENLGTIHHLQLTSQGLSTLAIDRILGRPELCGVVIETDPAQGPGVVLDNLGINGARYGTALAWSEAAWTAEARRRSPELVVFEYGGNEASDRKPRPDTYEREARQLIERLRRVQPDVSCLVVGLADRVDAEERVAVIRDAHRAAAQKAGCMFWDTYERMGGKGSLRAWREERPPRAAVDGVHLLPVGYRQLGAWLLADLMAGYDAATRGGAP